MTINIPGYTVVRKLGQGGSATVYLAVQQSLNRRVALKVLHGSVTTDPYFGERFKREGRIVAQLNHPHIVPVYEVGEHDHHYYMAMECLQGGDLRSRAGSLRLDELLTFAMQIAEALHYAHIKGFIHRDVKPENILFRNAGHAVLTDFGIARQTESLTHMTVTGALLGTPAYMSPEQIAGRPLDGRSDLYSLGVTLYEMLCGYQPYRGDSIMGVAMQHMTAQLPRLPKATAAFQPLLHTLLAKDPAQRPASGEALIQQIQLLLDKPPLQFAGLVSELWLEDSPVNDQRTDFYTRHIGPRKRWRWLIAVSGSAVLASGAFFYLSDNTPAVQQPGELPQAIVASSGSESEVTEADESQTTADASLQEARTRESEQSTEETAQAQQRREAIAGYLQSAERASLQNRLLEPEGDNALVYYRQVLALEADNQLAVRGMERIASQLLSEARAAIRETRFEEAETLLANAATFNGDNPQLATVGEELSKARVAHREQLAAEQARQALQERIDQLTTRVFDWNTRQDDAGALSSAGEILLLDVAQLLEQSPGDPQLRSLESTVKNRLLALEQQAESKPDSRRFNVRGF